MKLKHLPILCIILLMASCANRNKPAQDKVVTPSEKVKKDSKPAFVNPYKAGTYDHFKAEPSYPKTSKAWKNEELLAATNASNSKIRVSLAKQRGFLMKGDQIVIDYPICSGTKSHPTPRGVFPIREKIVDKSSNLYGKIYNAEGKLVKSNADMKVDVVPEGGKFEGSPMSYWMRLTGDGVGHHVGPVLRYPASHACIRGPKSIMPIVFSKVRVGTSITIE